MIDTITIQLSKEHFDYNKMLKLFESKFGCDSEKIYKKNNSSIKFGHYKNLQLFLSNNYLTITGSLTKLLHNNNLINASYDEIKASLNYFQSIFNVPMANGIVKRIDVGCNILLDQRLPDYLKLLICPNNFTKFKKYNEQTYEFSNKDTVVVFYDKIKEVGKKGKLPIHYKNINLLRYELRLKPVSLKRNGFGMLKFSDLYNVETYNKLVEKWYEFYQEVPKITKPTSLQTNFNSVSAFKDSLAIFAINQLGGYEKMRSMIKQECVNAKTRFDIRRSIDKLNVAQRFRPSLVKELDRKILLSYFYMLE